MAKAKVVNSDLGSAEFDELRKCVHTLLLLLESCSSLGSGSTAGAIGTVLGAIGTAVANGVDANGRAVNGVLPRVKRHGEAQAGGLVTLSASDKNY